MATSLVNQYISASFDKVVQISGSQLADGAGTTISSLDITVSNATTASYALYAVSASYEIIEEVSSSYSQTATSASHALFADSALSASTAGYAITSSLPLLGFVDANEAGGFITFTRGDGTTEVIQVQVTGSVENAVSASHALYAESAGAADQASLINVTATSTNSDYPILFAYSNGFQQARIDSQNLALYYNPSTNRLTATDVTVNGNLTGNVIGNASTATSASHAVISDSSLSATSSSFASTSISSSHALSADTSISSSYASNASTADLATSATNATYAQNTIVTGKNVTGSPIAKGTPLFFTGSGTAGNVVGILPADAGNANLMPAGGIAGEAIAAGAEGVVLIDGFINGVDTSAFAPGDEVFVGVGGGYTNVIPTGSANLIQKLGNVEKSAINGSGVINGPGATRSVPNIAQNNLWLGDANGVAQAVNQNTLSVKQAVSSSRSYVNVSAANVDYHVTFNTINAGYKELLQETEGAQFTYNPSNNKLTVANISATTLSGSLFGNATSATSASHAVQADSSLTANTASFVSEAVVAKTDKNNTFTGTQSFNTINAVSASIGHINYVTGSATIIGDAFVVLNTDSPALRYAGMQVIDSGSLGVTASLQWDSTKDIWMQVEADGTSAGFLTGMSGSLGTEAFPTKNTIVKGGGDHQITDSNISDDGTDVTIAANLGVQSDKVLYVNHIEENQTNGGIDFVAGGFGFKFNNDVEITGSVTATSGIIGDLTVNAGITVEDAAINMQPNSTINFFEYQTAGPTNYTSAIRFYSGSTTGANYINMQSVPGGNGTVAISSFPANNHFMFLNPSTFTTEFEGKIAGYAGDLVVGTTGSPNDGLVVSGSDGFTHTIKPFSITAASPGGAISVYNTAKFGGVFGAYNSSGRDFSFALDSTQAGAGNWTAGPAFINDLGSFSYPAVIGFDGPGGAGDNRVTFLTPISASAGITGDLTGNADTATSASHAVQADNATTADSATTATSASYATTSSYASTANSLTSGNKSLSGALTQTFDAPGTNQEVSLIEVNGAVVNGKAYNRAFFGIADYPGFGTAYNDYFAIEYYDSFSYNFGSEFDINGSGTMLSSTPSGSGFTSRAFVQTVDNYDGTAHVNLFAGTNGKIVLNAPNVSVTGLTQVTGSVVATVGFIGELTGSAQTAYNNNTASGSIGFWQGTQAEYDLISGSASDSIIYFVI